MAHKFSDLSSAVSLCRASCVLLKVADCGAALKAIVDFTKYKLSLLVNPLLTA